MNQGKARIKDIAELAGVSIGTVDRVLHDRGEVSERTREKILAILKETGYTPNIAARALKSSRRYRLVSLLPEAGETNSYWIKHQGGMLKAVAEAEPFPLDLITLNFDMQSEKDFQQKTSAVIENEPDGVMFAPIFKSESEQFCKKLNQNKIPFNFIDSYIKNTGFLFYVGEDVYQSGKVAGRLADMITSRDKDILVVNIARNLANVHHLKNRTQGFLNFFKTSGLNTGRKISINIAEPDPGAVMEGMNDVLKKYPDTGSIFVSGSKAYLIAGYLRDKGLKGINVLGYDLTDANVSYLKDGFITFLIGQRPEEQAYIGIKKLYSYLTKNKIHEKFEYIPMDIITAENVDYFLR